MFSSVLRLLLGDRPFASRQSKLGLTLNVISDASPKISSSFTSKWTRFVHPEGQSYFVLNNEAGFLALTEADINDIQTEERILDCLEGANHELQCHNIKLPSRCELFLELGKDQLSCSYYFVDHLGRRLFWLEDISTELLEIPSVMSSSHLGAFCCYQILTTSHIRTEKALERLYWIHVEYFPMHHKSHEQEFSPIVDDLYNIISHGQAGMSDCNSTPSFTRTTRRL